MKAFSIAGFSNVFRELNESGDAEVTREIYGDDYEDLLDEVVYILERMNCDFELKQMKSGIKIIVYLS